MIIAGELFKGAYGYSGEMGHMTIEANGRKCSCGNRGCWELYASEKAIAEAGKNVAYHSLEEIMQAAEQDEPLALHTALSDWRVLGRRHRQYY
ncbi:ROK family protein [Paenibacillus apiarius]|uniref:ROK family protein n=1 Tax=Paenibacillus apiarius TaxID=46240 RepID=UPI003B3B227C